MSYAKCIVHNVICIMPSVLCILHNVVGIVSPTKCSFSKAAKCSSQLNLVFFYLVGFLLNLVA